MSEAHRRKKQPEQVRRNLLECTAKIAAELGIAKVTIEAVAKAAGITKGGLLHHFPSKRTLMGSIQNSEKIVRLRKINVSITGCS